MIKDTFEGMTGLFDLCWDAPSATITTNLFGRAC
jgi:hypothetical protein